MEGFTYTNIFETKAVEYLIIVFFFAILVPFWMILSKKNKSKTHLLPEPGFLTAGSVKLPQGIFFSKYHTWAHLEKNGEAKVGVDDLILHLTGEVSVKHFKLAGETIEKGERLARICYNGNNLEVISPVSGLISSTNEMLSKEPGLIKSDPYQHGWIYMLKPANWKEDTDSCFLAEDATLWAKTELERFKDFLSISVMKTAQQPESIVMQDGGEIMEKALIHFPQEVWKEFQDTFLI
jgi:glycine cleavage system H protein